MTTRVMMAKPEHKIVFDDLIALCSKHADKVTKLELLAVAANMLGKLVALQDQRYVSSQKAMAVVIENMQAGNGEAVASLHNAVPADSA